MAVAPQLSAFEILDLRLVRSRSLAAVFEEEERHWREQLHWDYRPSVEIIRKHVDARGLPGYVAMSHGRAVGYCFFIAEESKATIGDLYVREEFRRESVGGDSGIATLLLEHTLETLEHMPGIQRIEGQLVSFETESLAPVFQARSFRSFPRLFMYKPLTRARLSEPGRPEPEAKTSKPRRGRPAGAASAVELQVWDDSYFEEMAELVVVSYRDHVDGEINDYYSSRDAALRFLKNIVVFPGCGSFQHDCSLVAVAGGDRSRERLAGAVLTSQVAPGVGHVTQICVRPEWQGHSLGSRLMDAALERLAAKGCSGVSLTVTEENQAAVRLYRQLGFDVLRTFSAFARGLR